MKSPRANLDPLPGPRPSGRLGVRMFECDRPIQTLPDAPRRARKFHAQSRETEFPGSESRRLVLFICAVLIAGWIGGPGLAGALAQDAYFHRGAQHFLVGSNQLAKAEVERGLQLHPDDPHLKKFWELLNQQSQDQQNSDDKKDQQDKQDQKDQKDQQKKDQDQQKDQKNQQDQQKQDQQQSKQDSQKQDQSQQKKPDEPQQQQQQAGKKDQEKKEGEEAKAGQGQKPEEQEGNPDGAPQRAAIQMTPQQAVRLLETLKSEERTLQFKPILRTNRTQRLLKDW